MCSEVSIQARSITICDVAKVMLDMLSEAWQRKIGAQPRIGLVTQPKRCFDIVLGGQGCLVNPQWHVLGGQVPRRQDKLHVCCGQRFLREPLCVLEASKARLGVMTKASEKPCGQQQVKTREGDPKHPKEVGGVEKKCLRHANSKNGKHEMSLLASTKRTQGRSSKLEEKQQRLLGKGEGREVLSYARFDEAKGTHDMVSMGLACSKALEGPVNALWHVLQGPRRTYELRGGGHPCRVPGGVDLIVSFSHLAAKGLLNRSFSHYDELYYVFGRDHGTGGHVETFVNVGSNVIGGYEGFIGNDGNDIEIPSMYSQGLDMSSDDIMGTRPRQASDGRNASSRSKRKWVGQTAIPKLTRIDRCHCMCILMHNVDNMKAFMDVPDELKFNFCTDILQENS
ncbi:retrotransposon protein [Cucumis melo var. makuwa]|uniref:Retrotransposon protein n=1 Tax=Cucumis melo var. makuwa TaxID=1194695 RepID=A0A5D3CIS8_CUCMM|nr:retrotransposon protein [Cucumis melo var. makuwa]